MKKLLLLTLCLLCSVVSMGQGVKIMKNGKVTNYKSSDIDSLVFYDANSADASGKIESITLDQTYLSMEKDATVRLVATILPSNADNKDLTWTSSNPDVAVAMNGLVIAMGKGHAFITASATDGSNVSASTEIAVVDKAVSSLELSTSSTIVGLDTPYTLSATINPDEADDSTIVWISCNPEIASVSEQGVISAHQLGETDIIAKANGGYCIQDTCHIRVKKYECVDLGLPSGTLWMTKNVGATLPTDVGTAYEWGEGLSLLPNEDPVYITFGEGYFTPSLKQFRELIEECDWTLSGDVYIITGKKYPYNSIYLPKNNYWTSSGLAPIGDNTYSLSYFRAYCLIDNKIDYSVVRGYSENPKKFYRGITH